MAGSEPSNSTLQLNKEPRPVERRKEMVFVPSSHSNTPVTHKIQIVRDIGPRASGKLAGAGRERQGVSECNNITLTFGQTEDECDGDGDFLEPRTSIIINNSKNRMDKDCKVGVQDVTRRDNTAFSRRHSHNSSESADVDANKNDDEKEEEEEANAAVMAVKEEQPVQKDSDGTRPRTKTPPSSKPGSDKTQASTGSSHGSKKDQQQQLAFCDPRQNQVFHTLTEVQNLRKTEMFSDVVVKVMGQSFRCHKFILACNSPFLANLMAETEARQSEPSLDTPTSKVTDGGDGVVSAKGEGRPDAMTPDGGVSSDGQKGSKTSKPSFVVSLQGVRPEIFTKILDFLYCVFDDVITEKTAMGLLLAADSLQLTYLSRTCANYITDTLSPSNVFDVISLCDSGCARLFEPKVVRRSHEVIREHFLSLCQKDEFLTLSRQHMIPLVADSMLHGETEMVVLQALLRWVQFRPAERTADMTLMLQHIRFPLMTSQELDKLCHVTLLKENSLAMALIEESRAYSAMDYNERLAWPRQNCISRCQFPTRDFILWTADRDKGLHLYSIIDGQHHKLTNFADGVLADNSSGHFTFDSTSTICCYGAKIFFTGGEFSTDMTWSVDTASGEVHMHAKMPRGRKLHSMVAARGCLYCLGGQDKRGYTVLDSVDAYVMERDIWVKVGHLSVPAYNMAAVVSGGAIYLVGGADQAGQPLRLVQCFIALRSGLYSAFKIEMSNMPPSLLCARAVTSGFDGLVYIVCGHGEVYKFAPEKRQMSHLTTLKNLSENPRVRFGLAHVGGCLVVIGGHQLGRAMQEPIRSVCLDIASKTEVRDYSPLLPGDIINTCLSVKLSSGTLALFE